MLSKPNNTMTINAATANGAGGSVTNKLEDAPTMELDASWLSRLVQNKQKSGIYFLGSGDSTGSLKFDHSRSIMW